LTAAVAKASLERSIRLAGDTMPPAFERILGVNDFVAGRAPEVSGISARSGLELEIRLSDPLPIFPSLSRRPDRHRRRRRRRDDGGHRAIPTTRALGESGRAREERTLLARARALLDRIEFRASLPAAEIAEGFRAGGSILARDLLPQDLDAILRDPRFRSGIVETPRRTRTSSCSTRQPRGREPGSPARARRRPASQEFVWGALGRFAMPATGIIPPGILGHDPGRRQHHLSRERASR
jgi:hypothetical protein